MFFDDWEQLNKTTIRPATPSDSRTIARIHVRGWRRTYRDFLPEDLLKSIKRRDREQTWMHLIAGGDSGPYVLVAEHPSDGIVGFAAAGPERSDIPDYDGEIYAIYVDEPHQCTGIGTDLMRYVAQVMSENAQQGLLLWTFSQSPGNGFFERLGGQVVTTRTRSLGDVQVEETAYGWPDIRRLLDEEPQADEEVEAEVNERPEHAESEESLG